VTDNPNYLNNTTEFDSPGFATEVIFTGGSGYYSYGPGIPGINFVNPVPQDGTGPRLMLNLTLLKP